ncbi:MAG TPA: type II toxin-antitoxin system HicA family toxin [Candidatus Acidoferrales bacterium]|nr:type II toxin-antitoxin system HicA family toxin [Candidatus Acidoferrales bacterium]
MHLRAPDSSVFASGSHVILQRGSIEVAVPDHRTIAKGTLGSILRTIDMTPDELRALL